MKKIKILGLKKSKYHNTYILPKKQIVFSIIREMLKDLGFQSEWDDFGRPYNSRKHELEYDKEENIKSKCYVDSEHVFSNNEYYIQIVFGKEKIFIMISMKKDKQQKISNFFRKFAK